MAFESSAPTPDFKFDISADKEILDVEYFYKQIRAIPQSINYAKINHIEHNLLINFQEIQTTATRIIWQFNQEKEEILKDFDVYLIPIAKDILEEMTRDANQLKQNLDIMLQNSQKMTEEDWVEHAKCWMQFYAKWHDSKGLTQRVLSLVAERATQLIDKDVRVIYDYQKISLSHLTPETIEFKTIEARLKIATEESLKELINLKQAIPQYFSLKQASEWVAYLNWERESFFDDLLRKIDGIMKEFMYSEIEQQHDLTNFIELEGEIAFMNHELRQIHHMISHLDLSNQEDVAFVEARLEEVEEHLKGFDSSHLPKELKEQLESISVSIDAAIFRLKG